MKQILLICAVVVLAGCGRSNSPEPQAKTPETPKVDVNTTVTPKPQPKEEPENPQPPKTTSEKLIANPIVEKAIRWTIGGATGELTKADFEKVKDLELGANKLTELPKELEKLTQLTDLGLSYNQLTDVKGLEKLTQLTWLDLRANPDLTKAQIVELQKALPNCYITSNPKK